MSKLSDRCIIRPPNPEVDGEVGFVYDSWLNSWRTSKWAGVIPNNLYYDTQRAAIEELVARGATVLVAEVNGELLGFACGEVKDGKSIVHYVFVKDVFVHDKDVADKLIAALPGTKPGWFTYAIARFIKDKLWKHAPEIARRQKL